MARSGVAVSAATAHWLKWTAALLLAPLVLAMLFIAIFGWNWLRGPLADRIGSATGRHFAINGDLEVHLAWQPRIVANDIVLANAAWSEQPNMAEVKRLDLTFDIPHLLVGRTEFPLIALSAPNVLLETGKDGRANWQFGKPDSNTTFELPVIGALTIDQGTLRIRDTANKTDLAFEISTHEGAVVATESVLVLDGKGRYKGMPATLHAEGGALLSLRSIDHAYPVKAHAVIGATTATIDGRLLDPLHFKGEQLSFTLAGSDLAGLFPLIGVPIPPTPAYKLAGFLDHRGAVWSFRQFSGVVGHSDLAGDIEIDRAQHPQMITATLVSKKLRIKDLGGFIGADHGGEGSAVPPPADKVLPVEPFNLEKLQAANADVNFRGDKIITETVQLEKMTAHMLVKNGELKLAPLDVGIAGGNLIAQITMDGSKARIVTRADITAKGLHLGQLFPASKLAAADTGTLGGRTRLDGNGNSIAQMLGTANGEAALIMDGGSVSELMLRMSNLDIANSLVVMLGGDKQVPIRCMVGNFKAVDGDFKVESLLLDTRKVNVVGSGDVNFTDESLHLRLVSSSKGFSLASLRGPIAITGTFKTPQVHPELGGVVVRGGLAVALGVVTAGIGTLIPLLDFGSRQGKEKDSACEALMNEAKADAGIKSSDLLPRAKK